MIHCCILHSLFFYIYIIYLLLYLSIDQSMRDLLIRAFNAAVAAVNPYEQVVKCLRVRSSSLSVVENDSCISSIPITPSTPLYLISFGKAAGAMSSGAEMILGDRLINGVTIVPKFDEQTKRLRTKVFEGGHSNLPDYRSINATKEVIKMVDEAECDAAFLVLISGGGSALLSLPSNDISLDMKLSTIRALVSKGASIQELNSVRRVLSNVKGGRLADKFKGRMALSLILSDIIGDPIEFIASGPTVSLTSSLRAATVIDNLGVRSLLPIEVINVIDREDYSPTENNVSHAVICNNRRALEASKNFLEKEGYESTIVSCSQDGDAEVFGRKLGDMNELKNKVKGSKKVAFLYGGETTVQLNDNSGKGGRNQHAALAALLQMNKIKRSDNSNISLLVGGSDGQDGPTDANGAIISNDNIDLSDNEKELAEISLMNTDSYSFWKNFRDGRCHFQPGLTGTNVMDIAIQLYEE